MISWGVLTAFVGLVHNAHQFYTARFLLGAAEAGFFPGILVYLTHWFRHEDRAKAIAVFMTAIPLSNIFGSPLAGQILKLHWYGLEGWRWLFILEGIPAVVFGAVTLFYLTDWPSQAAWLPKEESDWITAELEREKQRKTALRSYTIWQALRYRDVLLLMAVYFMGSTGIYGFIIWFPTILKRASGLSTTTVTFLVVLPYLVALIAMLLNSWHSDRTQERRWHTAISLFIGGAALILALATAPHIWTQLVFFIIFAACVHAYQPTFWALPTTILSESAAAGGMRQRADVLSGGSFASSNDQRVHFGLGQNTTVQTVEIHWPSGAVEHFTLPAVDRFYAVEEGKGIVPSVYDRLVHAAGKPPLG